jgi:hypothetical protein
VCFDDPPSHSRCMCTLWVPFLIHFGNTCIVWVPFFIHFVNLCALCALFIVFYVNPPLMSTNISYKCMCIFSVPFFVYFGFFLALVFILSRGPCVLCGSL